MGIRGGYAPDKLNLDGRAIKWDCRSAITFGASHANLGEQGG